MSASKNRTQTVIGENQQWSNKKNLDKVKKYKTRNPIKHKAV
jgi:hypothetical protein